MEKGDAISSMPISHSGMNSKRKVIILVQVFAILLIILAAVLPLYKPSSDVMPSNPVSSTKPSVQGSGKAPNSSGSTALTSAPGVPEKIGGLALVNVLTGQEAIDDMSMLHGKGVGVIGGWVGHYQSKAIAWVGEVADEKGAIQLLESMVTRIGAGNKVFSNLRQVDVDDQTAYFVTGLGQNHYFYQKGNEVIWLAMPTAGEDAFLRDALKLIK